MNSLQISPSGSVVETAGIEPAKRYRHAFRNFTLIVGAGTARHRLPVRDFGLWAEDRPRPYGDGELTRQGRPRTAIMARGPHGRKPGNAGRTYEYTPPTDAEIHRLKAACDTRTTFGRRNLAWISLTRGTGLRVHETLLLVPDDLDLEAGTILVRRGKGGKRRKVGVMGDAIGEAAQWLYEREDAGFTPEQPLFPVVEGVTRGDRLNQTYVRAMLHRLTRKAGIDKRITPHGLRHALALDMDRRHIPLSVIARQLGHSNVSTTATYLRGLSDDEVFDTLAGMELAREPERPSLLVRPQIVLPAGVAA